MSERPPRTAILFVDDEELSRKYFKRFFERQFEVYTAEDGSEGLKKYHTHRSEIGVVVTDQIMPEMTGLELLGALRQEKAPVVRVLSTAYTDSSEVAEAVQSGLIEFFITKPWDLGALGKLLQQAQGQDFPAEGSAA